MQFSTFFRAFRYILILIASAFFSVISGNPLPTQIEIEFEGEKYTLAECFAGIEKKSGDYRLIISMLDRTSRIKIMLSAELPQGIEKNQKIETYYHDAVLNYRSIEGSMMIAPSVRLAKKANSKAKEWEWRRQNREQRIRSGQGVIQNKHFAGTLLVIRYKPVIENGQITKAEITFHGRGKFYPRSLSSSSGQSAVVSSGPFVIPLYRGDR